LTLKAFDWRKLTAESAIEYALDDAGVIRVRGQGDAPPFETVRVRSGRVFVDMTIDELGLAWKQAPGGDGWILRTVGAPSTVSHVDGLWGALVRESADPAFDERLVLVTIAAEAGGIAPDEEGFVKAPRTEVGYPRRTGEHDPGDFDRDAVDFFASGGAHSSHGLMQTLISTARAARPDLFANVDPSRSRMVLWSPANSIACGVAHASSFAAAIKTDPVQFRVKYGSGGIRAVSTNAWGVDLYDESVMARFIALWNDDACVRAFDCTAPPMPAPSPSPAPQRQPATGAWVFASFALFTLSAVAAYASSQLAKASRAAAERVTS
jgi:hypothetical protein